MRFASKLQYDQVRKCVLVSARLSLLLEGHSSRTCNASISHQRADMEANVETAAVCLCESESECVLGLAGTI